MGAERTISNTTPSVHTGEAIMMISFGISKELTNSATTLMARRSVAVRATMGLGRKLKGCWKPTVWAYYDWASGDDATGAGNGFHHNFPLAHKYNGFMDLFGRRNLENVNFQLSMQPTERLKLLAWYHYFFLETQTDVPYSVVMTPFNGGNLPGSADLGHGDRLHCVLQNQRPTKPATWLLAFLFWRLL